MVSEKTITVTALWALLLLPPAVRAAGLNPHLGPGTCLACHSQVPSPLEAQAGLTFLLRGSIEETCGLCHTLHLSHTSSSHPTGIMLATDRNQPSTLPLSAGYITCKTCHHCIAADTGPTFAMLRISNNGASPEEERTELCQQCHQGY